MKNKNPFRIFWIILGFLCLGLGTAGIVLPVLPTVPFFMATVFCFAKSSKRLHDWFVGTKLYKKTSGQFCKTACHDYEDKDSDCWDHDHGHGGGISDDEQCSGRSDLSGGCVGMPPVVFLPDSEDH